METYGVVSRCFTRRIELFSQVIQTHEAVVGAATRIARIAEFTSRWVPTQEWSRTEGKRTGAIVECRNGWRPVGFRIELELI
jgi:hypothetical protein